MKIALVGKGGSGKTTLAALFLRHLVSADRPVLAVDADIDQHLAVALGATEASSAALPTLSAQLPLIKDYRRGANPRIAFRRNGEDDPARRGFPAAAGRGA